ncbi:MAG: PaaI family thioesterase [Bacteroidales bacterium]|nr:PaaI family thioesterase [Bacteroidales bacterium]
MKLIDFLNTNDRFAASIGAQLTEVREGYARAELDVAENHINGAGVCQGGVYYTLADLTFAAVSNSRGVITLGISNTITFLKSAKLGDHLVAECIEVQDHHRLPYCDIKVSTSDGTLVAVMTGLAYRTRNPLEVDSLM